MAESVTLTWADGDAATRFLRLRHDLIEHGYIRDSEGEVLQVLVARAQVSRPVIPAGETP